MQIEVGIVTNHHAIIRNIIMDAFKAVESDPQSVFSSKPPQPVQVKELCARVRSPERFKIRDSDISKVDLSAVFEISLRVPGPRRSSAKLRNYGLHGSTPKDLAISGVSIRRGRSFCSAVYHDVQQRPAEPFLGAEHCAEAYEALYFASSACGMPQIALIAKNSI